ncbi:hypothetical protein CORT_0B09560 [Candida orthopsilosis Co 90-125]|uniref:FHA domain-containing protein n=1 Tax=Candida orthopsilosis (strain 90-125) TaxID=1136231 RepID=H8X0E8_CANO9|nr:hypothetical protein CORT_0B09560 [Candida orthopsilosis Co 90-125]CCG22660.1 hypothetical protein CORT_0B09560 [Candida orthopsilosis Co 90-125]
MTQSSKDLGESLSISHRSNSSSDITSESDFNKYNVDAISPFPSLEHRKGGIIHIKPPQATNDVSNVNTTSSKDSAPGPISRKRSDSKSQVVNYPMKTRTQRDNMETTSYFYSSASSHPRKRAQMQYYVTLIPLNDTFIEKHLPVAIFPETTKLGRPTGTKHKPDVTNGYFDSRVLSRNHAQIYIDPTTGKLMLQDLGSSNGTYLNDSRLDNEPTEVKIGDIICLGFNVQAESTHKQISLRIDNINVIANTKSDLKLAKSSQLDTPEFKHLSFMEEIYRKINDDRMRSKQHASDSFDSAFFGDINPILEDDLLGLYSSTNAGIYNNSQITNTGALENMVNTLMLNLTKVKQQASALGSLRTFLLNYQKELDELNKKYLEQQYKLKVQGVKEDLESERTKTRKLEEKLAKLRLDHATKVEVISKEMSSKELEVSSLRKKVLSLEEQVHRLELESSSATETIEKLKKERDNFQLLLDQKRTSDAKVLKDTSTSTAEDEVSESGHDLISDAINGFIMDLSRTPSVRDSAKSLDSRNGTTLNDAIELTPPSSDHEGAPDDDDMQISPTNSRRSSRDFYTENLSSSSVIATNLLPNDVEPFPKVEDIPLSRSSSSISLNKEKQPSTNYHDKLSFIKLSGENKTAISNLAIATSVLLVGVYLYRLLN